MRLPPDVLENVRLECLKWDFLGKAIGDVADD
jgi:hypothetical protein